MPVSRHRVRQYFQRESRERVFRYIVEAENDLGSSVTFVRQSPAARVWGMASWFGHGLIAWISSIDETDQYIAEICNIAPPRCGGTSPRLPGDLGRRPRDERKRNLPFIFMKPIALGAGGAAGAAAIVRSQ